MNLLELQQIKNFGVYENIGGTPEQYIKDMSTWARRLEHDKCIPSRWCILDNKIHVLGNVDIRNRKIEYPFGVVAGFFYCDKDEEMSPNYPEHIGMLNEY